MSSARLTLLSLVSLSGAPNAVASEPATFRCCADTGIAKVIGRYLDIHEALTKDQPRTQVAAHFYAMRAEVAAARTSTPSERALLDPILAAVAAAKDAPGDQQRDTFVQISTPVIALALRHEGAGRLSLAEALCKGRPAWLQSTTDSPIDPWSLSCADWL